MPSGQVSHRPGHSPWRRLACGGRSSKDTMKREHQAIADMAECHVQPWRRGRPPGGSTSICVRSHSVGISVGQADTWFSVSLSGGDLGCPPASWVTPTTKGPWLSSHQQERERSGKIWHCAGRAQVGREVWAEEASLGDLEQN